MSVEGVCVGDSQELMETVLVICDIKTSEEGDDGCSRSREATLFIPAVDYNHGSLGNLLKYKYISTMPKYHSPSSSKLANQFRSASQG